jgi:hypothetical protein
MNAFEDVIEIQKHASFYKHTGHIVMQTFACGALSFPDKDHPGNCPLCIFILYMLGYHVWWLTISNKTSRDLFFWHLINKMSI